MHSFEYAPEIVFDISILVIPTNDANSMILHICSGKIVYTSNFISVKLLNYPYLPSRN